MRCLSRLCTASKLDALFPCRTGFRPYSFASDIQKLLAQFESDSSIPPILPATRRVLSDFHRDVKNPRISTKFITQQYEILQKHSTLRSLPPVTANLFLQRLLRARNFDAIVRVLLEYDLDESVRIATEVLKGLTTYEREYCLFRVFRGLTSLGQSGLAMQILVEAGLRGTQRQRAFKELSALQARIVSCSDNDLRQFETLCNTIALRMRGASQGLLDTYSAYLLMERALALGMTDYARELCQRCWHAEDAARVFLETQPENIVMELFMSQVERAQNTQQQLDNLSIWKYVIRRQNEPRSLNSLSEACPKNADVRFVLALQASRFSETLNVCFEKITNLSSQQTSIILFRLLKHSSNMPGVHMNEIEDKIFCLFSTMEDSLRSDVLESFLQLVKQSTAGKYVEYPMSSLMAILAPLDRLDYRVPAHILEKLSKHILHRPSDQLLQFLSLTKPNFNFIRGIVNHHLRVLRILDTSLLEKANGIDAQRCTARENAAEAETSKETIQVDDGDVPAYISQHERIDPCVFAEIITTLHTRHLTEAGQIEIETLHSLILHTMSQLNDPSILLSYLERTTSAGVSLTPATAANIIRSLAQKPDNVGTITRLLTDYPANIMTYDIFARYISRISLTIPASAMHLLKLLRRKQLIPKRRLLQNIMLGISESSVISEGRSFRYLAVVLALSKSLNINIDRIFLASLVRVVLIRQGLGVATQRLNWLMSQSSRLSSKSTMTYGKHLNVGNQELLEVLRKWHIYERSRGVEERTGIVGPRRPKKLRELVDAMAFRRSVIGRKKKAKQ